MLSLSLERNAPARLALAALLERLAYHVVVLAVVLAAIQAGAWVAVSTLVLLLCASYAATALWNPLFRIDASETGDVATPLATMGACITCGLVGACIAFVPDPLARAAGAAFVVFTSADTFLARVSTPAPLANRIGLYRSTEIAERGATANLFTYISLARAVARTTASILPVALFVTEPHGPWLLVSLGVAVAAQALALATLCLAHAAPHREARPRAREGAAPPSDLIPAAMPSDLLPVVVLSDDELLWDGAAPEARYEEHLLRGICAATETGGNTLGHAFPGVRTAPVAVSAGEVVLDETYDLRDYAERGAPVHEPPRRLQLPVASHAYESAVFVSSVIRVAFERLRRTALATRPVARTPKSATPVRQSPLDALYALSVWAAFARGCTDVAWATAAVFDRSTDPEIPVGAVFIPIVAHAVCALAMSLFAHRLFSALPLSLGVATGIVYALVATNALVIVACILVPHAQAWAVSWAFVSLACALETLVIYAQRLVAVLRAKLDATGSAASIDVLTFASTAASILGMLTALGVVLRGGVLVAPLCIAIAGLVAVALVATHSEHIDVRTAYARVRRDAPSASGRLARRVLTGVHPIPAGGAGA